MPSRFIVDRPAVWLPRLKPPAPIKVEYGNRLVPGLVFAAVLNTIGSPTPPDIMTGTNASATTIGTWSNTTFGPGMTFNGTSQTGNFGDRANWRPGGSDITVAVLANPISEANLRVLIGKADSGTGKGFYFAANADQNSAVSAGRFGLFVADDAGTSVRRYGASGSTLVDGNFHQFVGVVSQAAGVTLYIDGVSTSVTSNNLGGWPTLTGTFPLYMGSLNAALYWFNKQIVYAYYWKRALSSTEIGSLYAAPYQMFQSRPIQRWDDAIGGGPVSIAMSDTVTFTDLMGTLDSTALTDDFALLDSMVVTVVGGAARRTFNGAGIRRRFQ